MTRCILPLVILSAGIAAAEDKTVAVTRIRQQFADNRKYIHFSVRNQFNPANTERWLKQLEPDGRFSDLHLDALNPEKYNGGMQKQLAGKLMEAWKRIRLLAQITLIEGPNYGDDALKEKLMKASIHYGDLELRRCDGWFRFHASCFGIPRIVYGVYFAYFEDFDAAEKAQDRTSVPGRCSAVLRALMRQTFTQPKRDDVADPYTTDQFRKHVWWVGGNFAYRPTFETAAVCSDVRMFHVIAEVCARALGPVSHNTLAEAFWTEGICADSAGWGHGPQCYVWGYPSHGLSSVLGMLKRFRGTPWETALQPEALERAAAYVEGMCWYQYRGRQTLMSPGRSGFAAGPGGGTGLIATLARSVLDFDVGDPTRQRLERIMAGLEEERIGIHGTRVFWNNDDIIRRHPEYYMGANMVSARTQSNEVVGDGFSLYTDFFADGATFIHRDGLEYGRAKGAWDCSAIPGTTVRETQLKPVRLWSGYRGGHNLAGGVAAGDEGCAGFLYEKKPPAKNPNPALHGVRARKSYFFLNDCLVCLGAGIENLTPEAAGHIRTTIDQPEWRGPVQVHSANGQNRVMPPGNAQALRLTPRQTGDLLIRHNTIAYTVLAAQTDATIEIAAATRATEWVDRHGGNQKRKDLPESVPILRIGLDHGTQPARADKTDSYGYVVQPLGREPDTPLPARVLANSKNVQAVANPDGRLVLAVFFNPQTPLLWNGFRLQPDVPVAILLRDRDLYVSDLTQDPTRVSVTIETNWRSATEKPGPIRRLTIDMPRPPNCGSRAHLRLPEPQ